MQRNQPCQSSLGHDPVGDEVVLAEMILGKVGLERYIVISDALRGKTEEAKPLVL